MSSFQSYPDNQPSRISETAFKAVTWAFYGLAMAMAMSRTGFRLYTFKKLDADDCLLVLATICLTATVILIHILYPSALLQNKTSLGQYKPGPDFAEIMLTAKKIESASSNLTWFCIYSVKFSYLFFFRKLLQRQKRFMIWWWIVFGLVAVCAIIGIVFDWFICPIFSIDFLKSCPVWLITYREHIWLIVTTVLDIVTDSLIISVPVMILWRVKIPLRAKLGIGFALCLSLCMMVIAIVRVALGTLAPGVTDTVWTYFTFSLESSTAVFMVSATAFRSTFGHRKGSKGSKEERSHGPRDTAMGQVSRRDRIPAHERPYINSPRPIEWYEKDDSRNILQPQMEERIERARDLV